MPAKFIVFAYLIELVLSNSVDIPKVYEKIDESALVDGDGKRVPRRQDGSSRKSPAYSPPVFNFQAATQQDHQKLRYYQQQLSDARNFVKSQRLVRKQRVVTQNPIDDQISEETSQGYLWTVEGNKTQETQTSKKEPILTQIWHVADPKSKHVHRRSMNMVVPLEEVHLTAARTIHPDVKKNYQVNELDLEADSTNSHDQISLPTNPLQKHILKGSMAGFAFVQKNEKDVEALSALLGKSPQVQLEGLKQLLQSPVQTKIIIPVISGPQPFHVPQVRMDGKNLEHIQAQLDMVAKAETQRVLAQAREQAAAHVKAQHEAIARAQIEARKSAYLGIQQPNPKSLALVQIDKAVEVGPTQQARLRYNNLLQQQALAYAKAQSQIRGVPMQQAQAQTHVQAVHITPQPIFRATHQAEPYDNALIRQQQYLEESKKVYGGHFNDLQYASQYAFGYRIRDHHHGSDFGHEEKRDGEMAKGHYHVLLPDGRIQNVEYWADDSGYHAKVTYSNYAAHPSR